MFDISLDAILAPFLAYLLLGASVVWTLVALVRSRSTAFGSGPSFSTRFRANSSGAVILAACSMLDFVMVYAGARDSDLWSVVTLMGGLFGATTLTITLRKRMLPD
jgi:hypothetical protein